MVTPCLRSNSNNIFKLGQKYIIAVISQIILRNSLQNLFKHIVYKYKYLVYLHSNVQEPAHV